MLPVTNYCNGPIVSEISACKVQFQLLNCQASKLQDAAQKTVYHFQEVVITKWLPWQEIPPNFILWSIGLNLLPENFISIKLFSFWSY